MPSEVVAVPKVENILEIAPIPAASLVNFHTPPTKSPAAINGLNRAATVNAAANPPITLARLFEFSSENPKSFPNSLIPVKKG